MARLAPRLPGTVTFAFGGDVMFGRRYFDARQDGSQEGSARPGRRSRCVSEPAGGSRSGARRCRHHRGEPGDAGRRRHPTTTQGGPGRRRSIPRRSSPSRPLPPPRSRSRRPASMSSTWETTTSSTGCRRAWRRPEATSRPLAWRPALGSFGAGLDADQAWSPAIREVHGQRVAFLGCTCSFPGGTGHQQLPPTPDKGGAARCPSARLPFARPSQTLLDEPTSWW